ncbi:MAG: M50 family metallopeptidase [Kofleriaceae bacterium]
MTRALVVILLLTATARAEPSDQRLFVTGLAMVPPTYFLGVTLHEGSHAVMAKLLGAEVLEVRLFPPGRDPKVGAWRFGWTYVRGLTTRRDRQLFYIAPKFTDALLLGGFAAMVLTDAWPANKYGSLALTVLGTGLWVDFAKDVIAFRKTNDVVKVFDLWCFRGWRQVPARLVYSAVIVGFGLAVVRGFRRTFDDDDDTATTARIVPFVTTAF